MVASFMQPKFYFQLPERLSQTCHINCRWFYVHDQVRLDDDKLCYTGQLEWLYSHYKLSDVMVKSRATKPSLVWFV